MLRARASRSGLGMDWTCSHAHCRRSRSLIVRLLQKHRPNLPKPDEKSEILRLCGKEKIYESTQHYVQYIEVRYIEQPASVLAWICGTCSPPIFAGCGMPRGFRRMRLRMRQRLAVAI